MCSSSCFIVTIDLSALVIREGFCAFEFGPSFEGHGRVKKEVEWGQMGGREF